MPTILAMGFPSEVTSITSPPCARASKRDRLAFNTLTDTNMTDLLSEPVYYQSELIDNERHWIPACAGMTILRPTNLKTSSRRKPGSSGAQIFID
jgi:hypothetical protein